MIVYLKNPRESTKKLVEIINNFSNVAIGEWLNKLWYIPVMEYYCAQRNSELEEFHVNWNDLQELMQSENSRTRRTLYTEADNTVV